jgi:hypothetical protein
MIKVVRQIQGHLVRRAPAADAGQKKTENQDQDCGLICQSPFPLLPLPQAKRPSNALLLKPARPLFLLFRPLTWLSMFDKAFSTF